MQLTELSSEDRLRLIRFVCAFAWADLDIADAEMAFVAKLAAQLGLDDDERSQVAAWMSLPPRAEELDPNDIPDEHRELFLNLAMQMVGADGQVDPDELEQLRLFRQLLGSP